MRPAYQEQYEANADRYKGRNITYFDTIEQAISYCEELENPLVFIHAGCYKSEYIVIDSPIALIGAGESTFGIVLLIDYVLIMSVCFGCVLQRLEL